MKKIIVGLIAVISVLIMGFALTACADVTDSTYTFSDIKVAYGTGVSESDKARAEFVYESQRKTMEGYMYVFADNGSYTYGKNDEDGEFVSDSKGYYKQVGSTLYILSSASDIELEEEEELEEASTAIFEVTNGKIVLVEKDETTGTVVKTVYRK